MRIRKPTEKAKELDLDDAGAALDDEDEEWIDNDDESSTRQHS
ncbi:hypothetical protein VTO73DRAFT_13140 [Trametes versicolor]